MTSPPLLDIKNLSVSFTERMTRRPVLAIKNIDFQLNQDETLGIIGESGSGKSITLLSLMGLIDSGPGIISGTIDLNVKQKRINLLKNIDEKKYTDKWKFQREQLYKGIRGKHMSMIPQNPQLAFNPYCSIGSQINEMIRLHTGVSRKKEAKEIAIEWLSRVKMEAPTIRYNNNPYGLSGGMCQRAMIAMALSSKPSILFADEPTTGLDATIQSSIIDLLMQLKDEFRVSMIVVSHDFSVMRALTDRVMVYYKGQIVEQGKTNTIFNLKRNNIHPYTKQLLGASSQQTTKSFLSPTKTHHGCEFFSSCPSKTENIRQLCEKKMPHLIEIDNQHKVRCWKYKND